MLSTAGPRLALSLFFFLLATCYVCPARAASGEVDYRRTYLELSPTDYESLIEIPILAPVPFTGSWTGGHTMYIGAEIAMDIINSQQLILPGYRLNTTWLDDQCSQDYAPQLMIDAWNSGEFAVVGGSGCSAVCYTEAFLTPAIRMPFISYGCSSFVLSDTTVFPDFMRMMTDESDSMASVFEALASSFSWTRMVLISGEPDRFDAIASFLEDYFSNSTTDVEWLTPHDPDWASLLDIMAAIQLSAQRVIVLLGYEQFFRKAICAAYLSGIPEGLVWLSVGWHGAGWYLTDDEDVMALEPECNGNKITELAQGAVGAAGSGRPDSSEMSRELECLPGYTSTSFRALFWTHALELGYPLGDHIMNSTDVFDELIGYGADAVCAFAYMFRSMLIEKGYAITDMIKGSEATYDEAISILKNDVDFWGVSGRMYFDGNNKPGMISVKQVQGTTSVEVATVDTSGAITINSGESLMWANGETTPGSSFEACPSGHLRNASGSCEACATGTYYYELLQECVSCEVGTFNPVTAASGQASCMSCDYGYVSETAGSSSCDACDAGTYSNGQNGNGAYCVSCSAGYYNQATGNSECTRCSSGEYQGSTGSTSCHTCPSSRTTAFQGATAITECVCPEGTYEPYPTSSSDPYLCLPCPEGMTCPEGSNLKDWYGFGNSSTTVYPLLEVQYYSDSADPVWVYKCLDSNYCPGGDPGTCASHREGIACGRCESQHYSFSGTCYRCSAVELTTVLFPLTPLVVGPPLALFIYTRLLEPMNIKFADGPKNRALGLIFFFLVHFQTLGIIRQFNLELPDMVKGPWEGMGMINAGYQILRPECAGGGSFSSFAVQFVLRTMLPLFAAAFFVGDYIVFKCVPRFTRRFKFGPSSIFTVGMLPECTFNAFATTMYTFSLTVLAIAFELFKCFPHPNGLSSLRVSPDVMCYSSEWNAMLVVGIAAILVYFVFAFSLFSYVLHKAPQRYHDPIFRRTWKFLLVKWRPNCWWFGQVFLLKGVFINLTLVLFQAGALQVLWAVATLTLYAVSVMILHPWRHQFANILDNVVTLALMSIGLVSICYAIEETSADKALELILTGLTFLPVPIVLLVCCYLLHQWGTNPNIELKDGLQRSLEIEELIVKVSHQGVLSLFHALMNTTSTDRAQILSALKLLLAESSSTQVPGALRLLQRSSTVSDEASVSEYIGSANHHNLLLAHFQRTSMTENDLQREAMAIFGNDERLSYPAFEQRFIQVLNCPKGGAKYANVWLGVDLHAFATYTARTLDPHGDYYVSLLNFKVFARAMAASKSSLATLSFEVDA